MRKKLLLQSVVSVLAVASLTAAPLDLSQVAKDSKWLIHLDLDAFRKTQVGAFVNQKVIQPKIDEADSLKGMNLSLNLTNISSVTAYGAAFEKDGGGVLIVRTTADVKKDLDTFCGMASLSGGGEFLKLLRLNPYPIYTLKSNVFIAPNIHGSVLIAKSLEQIESARQILLGNGETMAKTDRFKDYPKVPNTFFFVGMAEGFNDNVPIPPQAQVLKETRGGRFVLGESGNKLFANLVFRGKSEESAVKIQQVLQGIVALVSLSQEDKDVTALAQGARIAASGNDISVNLEFPVEKAIQHLDEEVN